MASIKDTNAKMQEVQAKRGDDPQLASMQRFYEEMRRCGVAKKQEYGARPISTSGVSSASKNWLFTTDSATER
jgi:hypothetical protein